MALSDIRTRVYQNLDRSDIPNENGGLIDRFINDSQRQICRAYQFAFMETEVTTSTVDEQQNYQLPTGSGSDLKWRSEISCELIDVNSYREPLTRIFKQDAENRTRFKDSTAKGTPTHYSIQKGQIYLYPIPDHSNNSETAWTINLEYYGFLDDFDADTDTNDLETDHPEVLEALATGRGFDYAFEEEKAQYWKQKGAGLIQDMVAEDVTNQYGNIEEGMEPRAGAGATTRTRWTTYI